MMKQLKQTRLESDEQIKNIEARLKELNQVLQTEVRKMDARHNEYQLTKNLLEQMEGYPELSVISKRIIQSLTVSFLAF